MPSRTPTAGKLRHRVAVQKEVFSGQDSNGENLMEWETVATVWASIMPTGGSETWSGDQVSSNVTHTIVTRHGSHLDGFNSSWRLVFGERIFEVDSVTLRDEVSGTTLDWKCIEAGRLTTDPAVEEVVGA
jgi:SPP1 family predicted phage head-tail adaptor